MRRRSIVLLVLIAIVAAFGYQIIQARTEKEEKRQQEEARRETVKQAVTQAVRKTNAITDWPKTLRRGKPEFFKVFTADLEKVWITDRPVLFVGDIHDVALASDGNYRISVGQSILDVSLVAMDGLIGLRLECSKLLVDRVLKQNPTIGSSVEPIQAVAVIARIERVETEHRRTSDEEHDIKVGVGRCVDMLYVGRVVGSSFSDLRGAHPTTRP